MTSNIKTSPTTTMDFYKQNQSIRSDVEAVQWYVGSRKRDCYVYGIEELKEQLKDFPIELKCIPDGSFLPKGKAAVTITIYGNELISLGSQIETIVYHSLWYRSTLFTYLMEAKEHLIENGFDINPVGKINRGCSCEQQARIANEVYNKIFDYSYDSSCTVGDHANVLVNGEDYAFSNNHSVMIDTHNVDDALANPNLADKMILVDSGDPLETILDLLYKTDNHLCLLTTLERAEWFELVTDLKYADTNRIQLSIGSEVFQKVSRDDLDLIYKPCAKMINQEWISINKSTPDKITHSGYIHL